jgi:5-methylcytosine-specific restriction endonuclease McrA
MASKKPRGRQATDHTGRKFCRLTAIKITRRKPCVRWACRCDCGQYISAYSHSLVSGSSKSCGCYTLKSAPRPHRNKGRTKEWLLARGRRYYREAMARGVQQERARAARERRPEAHRSVQHRIRAKRRGSPGGGMTPRQFREIVKVFNSCCAYCLRPLSGRAVEIDHFRPLAADGEHDPSNIVPACRPCNARKGSSLIFGWVPRLMGEEYGAP